MEAVIVIVLLLIGMAALVWIGFWLADEELAGDRARLAAQREALRVQWRALEQARRVTDVFFQAREAMRRAEADCRETRVVRPERHQGRYGPWDD